MESLEKQSARGDTEEHALGRLGKLSRNEGEVLVLTGKACFEKGMG